MDSTGVRFPTRSKALEVGLAYTLSHSRLAVERVILNGAGDIAIAVRDDDTVVLEIESLDGRCVPVVHDTRKC